jgi:VanZ family protein
MIRKNILSISTALAILYLSLASSDALNRIPVLHFPGEDKIVHFIMYSFFTGVLLYENRKRIETWYRLIIIALIPFFFGALLELLQSWLTTSRTGSIFDLLFNLSGILFSVIIYLLAKNTSRE